MIRTLEELALNALPALQTLLLDGWVLRLADGYTRRANSVNPLYPAHGDNLARLRACESVYAAHGLPVLFKLTPVAQPAGLDAFLAAQGYTLEARTSVQTVRLPEAGQSDAAGFELQAAGFELQAAGLELQAAPTARWQAAFQALAGIPPRHHPTLAQMLGHLRASAGFALLTEDGQPAACGLGVVQAGYLGLFDIVTAPHARRRGLGRRLVARLLHWGRAAGAHTAYLQVMQDNAPALSLYAGLGFRELYAYWYRVQPAPTL
ncbi:MAG: GNAT family N-acetyltransferase [Anaerolineales bacterium]|nr:GNAT family N-acetyltransferase [Anaerolineales bacterium]